MSESDDHFGLRGRKQKPLEISWPKDPAEITALADDCLAWLEERAKIRISNSQREVAGQALEIAARRLFLEMGRAATDRYLRNERLKPLANQRPAIRPLTIFYLEMHGVWLAVFNSATPPLRNNNERNAEARPTPFQELCCKWHDMIAARNRSAGHKISEKALRDSGALAAAYSFDELDATVPNPTIDTSINLAFAMIRRGHHSA